MVQVGQPEAPQAIKQPKLEPPQQEALRRVKVLAGGDKTAIEQEFSQSEESSLEQMIQTAAGVRKSLLDLQVPGGANQETFQARLDAKYTEELAKAANPNDPGEIKKARIAAAEAVEKDLQSAFPDFAEQVRDYAPLSSLEK
ncbi:MAG: hypothetical protein KGJ07_08090, partial [Patescibacteria group bacterium]|nr:hypothetical protein [Patescibacteria group bacterium]